MQAFKMITKNRSIVISKLNSFNLKASITIFISVTGGLFSKYASLADWYEVFNQSAFTLKWITSLVLSLVVIGICPRSPPQIIIRWLPVPPILYFAYKLSWIPVVTLLSLSKTLNYYCFPSPRSKWHLRGRAYWEASHPYLQLRSWIAKDVATMWLNHRHVKAPMAAGHINPYMTTEHSQRSKVFDSLEGENQRAWRKNMA